MSTVVVRGLDGEGPGDIVGAFVNEAGVAPDDIGDIDVAGDEATVELADDATETVLAEMDGERVGDSEVSVRRFDDREAAVREYVERYDRLVELEREAAVREYVERYDRLVELEREAEMRRHEREIESLSGRERQDRGRAILGTDGRDEGEGLGGYRVKFVREDGLPETEIGVGDLVMVSKRDPLRDDNPTGTVARVTGHSVTVAFDEEPPGFVFGSGVRLDHYVNDVTYQRMKDALDELRDAEGDLAHLRDVIVGVAEPYDSDPAEIETVHDESLNDSQRAAVRRAAGSDDVHLIHGPPGTGKTTTAVEVIRQCVARDESVLATAASNAAVDNVVEFLAEAGVDVLRVGHPARVTPSLREHTLDSRIEDNETYRRSQELREEAFEVLDELDEREDLLQPSGRWRRGLSDERIRELAEEGRGSRGVPPEKIERMAAWLERRDEADELFERSDELQSEATAEEIAVADVVCTTNSTAGSDLLADATFDTLVIDEATQATEPSCLIPLVSADRVVMAGDHRQLPPTVQSEEAAREGLRETLFERLAERYGSDGGRGKSNEGDESPDDGDPGIRSLLRRQYRMHEAIQDFPAERFYERKLVPDESVRDHTLRGLGVDPASLPAARRDTLDPDEPVTFVNTAGADAPERQRQGSTSRENPREAEFVARAAADFLDAGVAPGEIAVISPYDDQADRIEDELARIDADREALEVDTVDGFQGREKEVVLVSLVRSNDRGEIGFLDDPRRFNVALTRARRKAVVVGDADTVTAGDVFADFVEYVRARGSEIRLD